MAQVPQEMTLEQQLVATIALRSFGSKEVSLMSRMAKGTKPPEESAKEIVSMFPTWQATARQIKLIIQYLRLYGEE